MAIHIIRLGSPRVPGEALRLGTVRRPPRGVRKAELSERNFYDVWFPNLAPSEALLKESYPIEDTRAWRRFERAFRKEMSAPGPTRDLDLLAALSSQLELAVGCYCENEARCHRSLLQQLLEKRGAAIAEAQREDEGGAG